MSPSRQVLYFSLFFIGGIFLSSFFNIPLHFPLVLLIWAIFFISVFWNFRKIAIFGFCLLFLSIGIFRHQLFLRKLESSPLKSLYQKEVVLMGTVCQEPEEDEKKMKLVLKVEKIENQKTEKAGRVLIFTDPYSQYQYGDRLKIKGILKEPPVFEEFNYKDYLQKERILALFYSPQIELIERNQENKFLAKILKFKKKLKETIDNFLPFPESSILEAMLLGNKKNLPTTLKEKLNLAGLRHITAVSGLHITILTAILMNLFLFLGFWRTHSFWLSLLFIFLFVAMTGFQVSAIRAALMGFVYLLGQFVGRKSNASRILWLVAALMLIQNPLLLKSDIGFQLSFLATFGIINLAPHFNQFFKKPLKEKDKLLFLEKPLEIFFMGLAAQIFTLPILIYNFGYLSLVAPLTNVLVVPFLYWVMLFGFIFLLGASLFPFLASFLALPAYLLLAYILTVTDFFTNLSFSSKMIEMSWIWMVFIYLLLIGFLWLLKRRAKNFVLIKC